MPENHLWEQFLKRGTNIKKNGDKAFTSPEVLIQGAIEYFRWCDSNPMYKVEQLKKPGAPMQLPDGTFVPGETLQEMPVKRPYSETGLMIFLGVNKRYFDTFKLKHKPGGMYHEAEGNEEWMEAIDAIESVIRTQQIDGATSGFFNSNIVTRMFGLVDKKEIDTTISTREVFKIGGKEFEL